MSILSVLGEIVLGIGNFIASSASSNLKSMSYDKRFSEEDRERCLNASEEFAGYSDKIQSKANDLKDCRHKEQNQ